MFGGVEQLIRDSQDWAYRDQAQLATGFENWGGEVDATGWNGGIRTAPAPPPPPPPPPTTTTTTSMHGISPSGYVPAVPATANSVEAMANWLNSMNAYNLMAGGYDEDEWYQ
jgi:hypothetical protein